MVQVINQVDHITGIFSNASNIAASVDSTMTFIVVVSVVFLVIVTFFMVFFAIYFRKSRHPEADEVEGNTILEITWTVIPTILVIVMFFYGYSGFKLMKDMPDDALRVDVTGRMWSWMFTYENGQKSDELLLPRGRAAILTLRSEDVLHSLFIPDFRVKEDAVPGQETHLWFIPEITGSFNLFCTEYCGMGHSSMLTRAVIMEPTEFEIWYSGADQPGDDQDKGEALVEERGCLGCHTLDGSKSAGPSFKNIYGRVTVVLSDGQEKEIRSDEDYLLESILYPKKAIVKGFSPFMPEGLVSESEAAEIIQYFKNISGAGKAAPSAAKGKALLGEFRCLGCHSTDGSKKVGPTFKGIYGRISLVITNNEEREIVSDEEYLSRSILSPKADVVKGFKPFMPDLGLTDAQARDIIEYLKTEGE